MGWQDKVRELAWEAKQDKLLEERQQELLHIEAEQVEAERLEREKNSVIEPDFEFTGVKELSVINQSEAEWKWNYEPTAKFERNKESVWFREKTDDFVKFMRDKKGLSVENIPNELDKASLILELQARNPKLWASNVDDWIKSQLFFKGKRGRKRIK